MFAAFSLFYNIKGMEKTEFRDIMTHQGETENGKLKGENGKPRVSEQKPNCCLSTRSVIEARIKQYAINQKVRISKAKIQYINLSVFLLLI